MVKRLFYVGKNTHVTNTIIITINVNRGALLLILLFLLNLVILYKYHVFKRKRDSKRIVFKTGKLDTKHQRITTGVGRCDVIKLIYGQSW